MFLCLFQSGANTKELFTLGLGFLYASLSANTNRHCTNHILSTHQKEVWVHSNICETSEHFEINEKIVQIVNLGKLVKVATIVVGVIISYPE